MVRSRCALILTVTFTLVVTLLAHARSDASGATTGDTSHISWSRCGELECGDLSVPLEYGTVDPVGVTDADAFVLAVARRPADDRAARIGTLVVNPGGPGVPAIAYLRAVADSFPRSLRARFDLVAFDPRGVGESEPVVCSKSLDPLFDEAFSPRNDSQRAGLVAAAQAVADDCVGRSGAILAHVSTQDTARDLDRLRAALGEKRLSFLGSSYGSYLGAMYITYFPDRARAFVLDGAIDPDQTAAEATVSQARGFEAELDAFLADCDAHSSCPFHSDRDGGSGAAYDALRARSARTPLATTGDGGRTLNETRFDAGVLETLYEGRSAWPALAAALADAQGGDAGALLAQADAYTWRRADGTHDHVFDAFWAISCLDGPVPDALGAVGLERLAALSAPRLGAFVANSSVICSLWPVPPVAPPPTISALGAPKVLIVGASKDPATPLAAGRAMRRVLTNARLLFVDADRHTSFNTGNECVDDAVTKYLVDRVLPDPGTWC